MDLQIKCNEFLILIELIESNEFIILILNFKFKFKFLI